MKQRGVSGAGEPTLDGAGSITNNCDVPIIFVLRNKIEIKPIKVQ